MDCEYSDGLHVTRTEQLENRLQFLQSRAAQLLTGQATGRRHVYQVPYQCTTLKRDRFSDENHRIGAVQAPVVAHNQAQSLIANPMQAWWTNEIIPPQVSRILYETLSFLCLLGI